MKNFKELRIWQKGFEIAVQCYKLTHTFPHTEKYGLSAQINRAAVSISSNIAEGSSRSSDKDYCRFVEIALGSLFELETQLHIAQELKLGNQAMLAQILLLIIEEQKMIHALIYSLKKPIANSY